MTQLAEHLLSLPPRLTVYEVADVARHLDSALRTPVLPTPRGRTRRRSSTSAPRTGGGGRQGRQGGRSRAEKTSWGRAVGGVVVKLAALVAGYQLFVHLVREYVSSIGG